MMDEDNLLGDGVSGDRKFVSALARGLDVLRCFRPFETTLTNQEIAARTGLPKPTVSRLAHTLCKLDYLVFSERTGTYRLGSGVLALGYGVLAGMEMTDRAHAEMKQLCESGSNIHVMAALGERHRMGVIYTAVHRAQAAVSLSVNVGLRLPLFRSAVGRALLVSMSEQEREHLLYQTTQDRPAEASAARASVEKALEEYDRLGYCSAFGDWMPEVNGIAVPVVSLNGDRVYGMNIGGPSFLVTPEVLQDEYAERLKAAARALSRTTGGE